MLIAVTTLVACTALGGAVYETLVVDPFWPKRPGIIQTQNGGIARVRFWLPVHTAFELLLVVSLVLSWGDSRVAGALFVAVLSHVTMRIWTAFDLAPKAAVFERRDPADVDEAAAVAWTRRSMLRLPLMLVTCGSMLTALVLG